MKTAARKTKTVDVIALMDSISVGADEPPDGMFTTRQFADRKQITYNVAYKHLRRLANAGELREEKAVVNGIRTNCYGAATSQ